MTGSLLAVTALAATMILARPASAQGTPDGNVPGNVAADTGTATAPGGHGFDLTPAGEATPAIWFAPAPVYAPPVWFPFIYSPPYPGPLNPMDFAVLTPAAVYGNLPMLGINTPLHTAGGQPVRYIRTRAAINLVPGE
jgi:hypothetical protein